MTGEVRQMRMPGGVNGFFCEILDSVEDNFSRAVIAHNIIGYNGVELEDMGLRERTISFTALFNDVDYNGVGQFLNEYVQNSGSPASDHIIHPQFGFIYGKIVSLDVIEDAREIASCRIRINFVEDGKPNLNGFALYVFGELSLKAPNLLSDCLAFISKMVSGSPRGFMDELSAMTGMVTSSINLAQTQLTSFVNAMLFPATIPGEIARAAFGLCATFEKNLANIMASPLASIQEIQALAKRRSEQIERNIGTNPLSDALIFAGVTFAGSTLARFLDAANTQQYKESILPNDVLRVNRQFRLFAQEFIQKNRADTTALAEITAMLDDATRQTIANLSGYRKVYIDSPRSIYTILLQYRIHRLKADIVLDINGIINPNTVEGNITIPQPDYEN